MVTLLAAAGVAAAGVWGASSLEVETDITHLLPPPDEPRMADVMRAVTGSELNRTVTLTVEAPSADVAAAAARELATRLADHPDVAWVRAGPDEDLERTFYQLYFARRLGFVSDRPEQIPELVTEDALRERARDLRQRLASPTGPFVRRIAPEDPWLLFPRHLERLRESMRGGLRVHDGAFVTEDGRHGIVLLATERPPFDTASAARVQSAIDAAFAAVNAAHEGRLGLEQAGVHRIALASERHIREDVSRVSIAGTLGVLLFLILIFGSPRYVLLGIVPIAAGVACAFLVSALAFQRVHGLTLAFGATLIGVAIDYVAHYLNHHVLAPAPDGAAGTMRRIWPGLALGGLTTVAGVAALGWTGYPAIGEMALFTAAGVLAALVATRVLLPPWLPDVPRPTRLHRAATAGVARALAALARRRRLLLVVPAAAALLIAAGASRVEMRDEPHALAAADPALLAEDARVRERVARVDAGRFVVALGEDVEAALRVNDRVHRALERAREDGLLARHRSLHGLLWSARLQRDNRRALAAVPDAVERTDRAYAAEGFVEGAFAPFHDALEQPVEPLRLEDVEDTALGPFVAPFVLRLGNGGVAVLTFLHGVRDERALAARIADVEGAVWWNQSSYLADAYARFRTRTFELLAVGLVFVVLLVAVRYRSVRETAAAVAPAVLAVPVSLAVVALAGVALTLVHALTLLLVLSMGVDYGVFVVESRRHAEGIVPTVTSLLVACVSTVLSFGALALSAHPTMRAMGETAAIGVAASLVLAPAAWLLVGRSVAGQR